MLLTQPISREETKMPSPNALKKKFVIKHKKLPDDAGTGSTYVKPQTDLENEADVDVSNAVKNGLLYLEDPIDKEWKPHFFMLTHNKMYYAEEQQNEEEEEVEATERTVCNATKEGQQGRNDELHFGEKWFHGKLPGKRPQAEELLNQYSHLGDGTFLVRESETFIGDYTLSFWRQGKVNHCRIRTKQERGQKTFFLIDTLSFDSLYGLITHYQSHPLRSQEFFMYLTEPVPQPNCHENKEWYHPNLTRFQAEDMLKRSRCDGAYLVRPSEKEENCFAISFRAENKIKHCRIKQEGRLFLIGNTQYESLVELINFYEKYPLYKKVKLLYPVNGEDFGIIGAVSIYLIPLLFKDMLNVINIDDYTQILILINCFY